VNAPRRDKALKDATPAVVARPRSRDADRTRLEILAAATAEFAERGLGGGRMEHIAERACVDKRLIYYYFDNKDHLFLAVLESAYAQIRAAERALRLEQLDPVEAVRRLVEFTWNYYLDNPEFLCLLNSENLHRAVHLKRSEKILEMHSPLIELLGRILCRGAEQAVFRADVDPVQLYISIASEAYFYLSNSFTLSVIFGRDLRATAAQTARLTHITEVIQGYLRPDAGVTC
jgi:AcrR family transcriptional regulator